MCYSHDSVDCVFQEAEWLVVGVGMRVGGMGLVHTVIRDPGCHVQCVASKSV